MAEKYTYADVIVDPNDPRVEIGEEYYFGNTPQDVLGFANKQGRGDILKGIVKAAQYPFGMENQEFRKCCLIRKKEPAKKYVPFDLTKEEDRDKLRGAWVRIKDIPNIEYLIYGLNAKFVLLGVNANVETDELLRNYEFVYGSPCGKLVEEE